MKTYIELVQGLGVEGTDEELGALIDILLVLFEEDGVEVSSCLSLSLSVSVTSATASSSNAESISGSNVADESALGSSVDESLSDEDLSADDDDGGGQELSVDDGHAADERDCENDGLHFAVKWVFSFCYEN